MVLIEVVFVHLFEAVFEMNVMVLMVLMLMMVILFVMLMMMIDSLVLVTMFQDQSFNFLEYFYREGEKM